MCDEGDPEWVTLDMIAAPGHSLGQAQGSVMASVRVKRRSLARTARDLLDAGVRSPNRLLPIRRGS